MALFAEGLPEARREELGEREEEVARRRVNASLCAFGGVAVPSHPHATKGGHFQRYEESIPERYFEEEDRLSWEIEEDPPVELSDSEDEAEIVTSQAKPGDYEEDLHCDLCGVTKHHHDCPHKASLQRNIGVMVYPAVNAFTATEPGIITPALSEMNNFVDKNKLPHDSTPAKAQTEFFTPGESFVPVVSPDGTSQRSVNYAGGAWISNHQSPGKASPGKDSESPSNDLLFVDVQELSPEQYRAIVGKKRKVSKARYLYPALPLPYGQRKRISNAMFAMSKSVSGLTDECASVLAVARRSGVWDFAVAQLMTQVIVVTHCSIEDSRLDGLSKYLLTLGIAC